MAASSLNLDHIHGDIDLEAMKASTEPKPEPKFDPNDPRAQSEYTFEFSWTDKRGKVWAGKFTSKILTIAEQSRAGRFQADLAGNIPFQALDPATATVNFMMARLTFALINDRPEWAKNLSSIKNVRLLEALYEEVARHEATFHGDLPTAS